MAARADMIARAARLSSPTVWVVVGVAMAFAALHWAAARGGLVVHGLPPLGTSTPVWALAFMIGWALMTGAMNLPSLHGLLDRLRRIGGSGAALRAAAGVAGVWLLVGALVWLLLLAGAPLLRAALPGQIERAAGMTLLLAAAYQLSPLARGCQEQCARPASLLLRHWGQGASPAGDAWRIGLDHGWNCVGCCLPMIAMMFVVGMGDLRWLAVFALAMALQKSERLGRASALLFAAVSAGAGLAILAGWWRPELLSMRALCAAPLWL